VLDALDARDDADNTVIVFFSDHGFHMGEKQYWAKRSLWDRATKVPMMIAAPGVKGDRKCDKPVGLIDVYNTLVDLCGLPDNDRLEGQSLEPLLEDPNKKWPRPALTTFGQNNHGLRFERWRYIQYADGSKELYDHENDPHEWHNLAGDPKSQPVIEELKKWLPKVNLPECPGTSGSGWQASEYAQGRVKKQDLFVE
jgi:arylsulfatase A-like enzyme